MSTELLYKSYRSALFSLAYRMLGSVMDAEDIVQEAFISYNQLPHPEDIRNESVSVQNRNESAGFARSSAKSASCTSVPGRRNP